MNHCCEFDQSVAAEDGVVRVVDVHHIEGYCFGSLRGPFAECDIELFLAESFDPLASEANKRYCNFCKAFSENQFFYEALPHQDVCGAAIVDQDSPDIVFL